MRTLLLLLTIFLQFSLCAQDAFDIMTSDAYKWAPGEGATAVEAKENAKKELLNSIITNVISSVSTVQSENITGDEARFSGLYNSYTRTYSKLRLKNLNIIMLDDERGLKRALAYILNSDFEASVNEVNLEIREMVRLAEQKEKTEGIVKAFYDYYLAYLNTFYSPSPISYTSDVTGETAASIRVMIEAKLRTYLSSLKILPAAPFLTPGLEEQIEIPVSVFYKNTPAPRLAIKIENTDSPVRIARNGKVNLFLYSLPSAVKQSLRIAVSPAFEEDNELKELHAQFAISEKTDITVDFSGIIKVDFSYKAESATVFAFKPEIKNLSISKTEWDFGDGKTSSDYETKHLYKMPGRYNVSLQLNSDPALKITKQITVGDETVVIRQREPEKEKAEPPAVSADPPVTKKPAVKETGAVPEIEEAVLRATQFKEIITILDGFKSKGLLIYGKNKDEFRNPDRCHIIICDPVTGEMKAFLQPGGSERKDLLSGKIVAGLSIYKGLRGIWVEAYK